MAAETKRVHPNDDDEEYVSMGARLRQAREYLGLSQEAVAEALGVPRASVSAMESGRRKVSSLELRALARLYKRPLDWFYGSDAEPIQFEEYWTFSRPVGPNAWKLTAVQQA